MPHTLLRCEKNTTEFYFLIAVFAISVICTIILATLLLILNHINSIITKHQALRTTDRIYIYMFIISAILAMLTSAGMCDCIYGGQPGQVNHWTAVLAGWCYELPTLFLFTLFYRRIQHIFANNSAFQLKTKTKIYYRILFVILFILLITTPLFLISQLYLQLAILLFMIIHVIFWISLNLTFVIKSFQIYRSTNYRRNNVNILHSITKVTILNTVSYVLTIIIWIFSTTWISLNIQHKQWASLFNDIGVAVMVTETFIKTICVLLMFPHFNKYYVFICGYLDQTCFNYWIIRVG
eukprot:510466_1